MKVSVEKIAVEQWSVEFTLDEVREHLKFRHESVLMRLPNNAILSYTEASQENGPAKLVASFEVSTEKPEPSGLTQQEIDVWGLIRQAGEDGITYARLETVMDNMMSIQSIGRIVRSLAERGLVAECVKKAHRKGFPPRKMWRSIE